MKAAVRPATAAVRAFATSGNVTQTEPDIMEQHALKNVNNCLKPTFTLN